VVETVPLAIVAAWHMAVSFEAGLDEVITGGGETDSAAKAHLPTSNSRVLHTPPITASRRPAA
jgi:hypothetical protein